MTTEVERSRSFRYKCQTRDIPETSGAVNCSDGDNLFTPFVRKKGLPIGNLTSQFFGNLYLTPMDQFIKNTLKAKKYLRYMDDFAIFSDDKEELTLFLYQINNFLVEYRLKSHKNKSFVRKTSEGITFLGFVIYPDYILLHSKNLSSFKKRIKKQKYLLKNGKITSIEMLQSLTAWNSHVKWGDTFILREKILKN